MSPRKEEEKGKKGFSFNAQKVICSYELPHKKKQP